MSERIRMLMYISAFLCFILGIVAELMGFNKLSCWLIAILLLVVFIMFFPKLAKRFKKKKRNGRNLSVFCRYGRT